MLSIYTPIEITKDAYNNTVYYSPSVEITTDISENVDVVKLRQFQKDLNSYIENGLNRCIIRGTQQLKES